MEKYLNSLQSIKIWLGEGDAIILFYNFFFLMKKSDEKIENEEEPGIIDMGCYNPVCFSFGKEIDENGFFDISKKSPEELENIRLELIEKCVFTVAALVDEQKKRVQYLEDEREAELYSQYFEFLVQQAKETYDGHFIDINRKYRDAENRIRKTVSESFHKMQVNHISALVESEKEFIIRNTKLTMKSPKKAKDLIDQANATAKFGNLADAQDLVDKATEIDQNSRFITKSKVSQQFIHIRTAMLRHQKMEIQDLTTKLKTKLALMEGQMNEEIVRLNTTFVKEIGLAQTAAKKNAIKSKNKSVRDIALEMITKRYKEEIEEFNIQMK